MTITSEKTALASRLAQLLRELATACERAAEGDAEAKKLLSDHIDNRWFALVVGGREVGDLVEDDEE